MASDSGSERSGTTRAHRFELSLWYDEGVQNDPAQWRFTVSDIHSNEQVGGVGVAGIPEAVALLTSRFVGRPTPARPGLVTD